MITQSKGITYGILAYVLWGILPIYWKLIQNIQPLEIIIQRVIWSFFTMTILLLVSRNWKLYREQIQILLRDKKKILYLTIAAFLITENWLLYIWAVNNDNIIEASLGYYINPLVSILLGVIFLKEKLNPVQVLSIGIASVGVLYLTTHYGHIPYISLILAVSFAVYGLCKKLVNIDALFSLFLETLIVFPVALLLFGNLLVNDNSDFTSSSVTTIILITLSGIITVVPLLYFGKAAQVVPLSTLGFIQFINPTLSMVLGIFLYGETFTSTDFVSFSFIWVACLLFAISQSKFVKKIENKLFTKSA